MVILNQIKKINFSIKIFLKKKIPKKILINYLKFKISFLKIDNDLRVMVKDFFRFDVNKVSKLWLYLLYAHFEKLENINNNNFKLYSKRIFRNYTLRFNTLENYVDINKILKINILESERQIDRDRNRQRERETERDRERERQRETERDREIERERELCIL